MTVAGYRRGRMGAWFELAPLRALAFFALVGATYWLLSWGEDPSDSQSSAIVDSLEWSTWKASAAFAIVIALSSAVIGIATIGRVRSGSEISDGEGASAQLAQLAEPVGDDPIPARTLLGYGLAAALFVIGALALASSAASTPDWPPGVPFENARYTAWIVGCCGIPWLMLVWLLQRHFAMAHKGSAPSIEELRRLWDLLNAIILAFAVFVVLALVTTGALRVAYFAGDKDPAPDQQGPEFPSTNVLGYGAYFAVLLTAIALPMVSAYRSAARRRVSDSCNLSTEPISPDVKERLDTLEALLHLNVGVLRSPITALTVFTPLITAALAAYLPEIAS